MTIYLIGGLEVQALYTCYDSVYNAVTNDDKIVTVLNDCSETISIVVSRIVFFLK